MKNIDIDAVLGALEKPAVSDNLSTILEMLEKADTVLKQVETVMTRLDNMGLKPLIVRGLGIKLGVDAETPLQSYKSETHKKFIEGINQVSEDDLKKQLGSAMNVQTESA